MYSSQENPRKTSLRSPEGNPSSSRLLAPPPPAMAASLGAEEQDKVCDICGDAGFSESIVTCCKCRRVSEHIYCMPGQILSDREDWHCEDCQTSSLVSYTNRQTVEHSWSNVSKGRNPIKRSSQNYYDGDVEQINDHKIDNTESQKSLCTQDWSFKMSDVGRRVSVTDSASDMFVTRPLSRRSIKTVGNAKVKFIPSEELLAPRTKARISHIRESSGVLLARTNQKNTMDTPLSQRTSSGMSLSKSSKMILNQQKKGATNVKVQLPSSSLTSENAVNDKGKEFGVFYKEFEVGLDVNHASLEHIIPTEAKGASSAQTLPNYKERKRLAEKALEKEDYTTLIKEEPEEGCSDALISGFPLSKIEPMKSKCISTLLPFDAVEREDVLPCLPDTGFRALDGEAAANRLPTCGSGNILHGDAFKMSGYQRKDLPSPLLIVYNDERPHFPVTEPVWKGEFEICGVLSHVYQGIQAHIPGKVAAEANEMLKQVPVRIKSTLHHRLDVWPKKFRLDPPGYGDIGLYFFPSHSRFNKKFIGLVEEIDKNDLAMQSWIGDVELLIFSSKQLSEDYQGYSVTGLPVKFLWGVFRCRKCKQRSLPRQGQTPAEVHVPSISTCTTMEISLKRNFEVKLESMEIDTSGQNLLENNSDYMVAGSDNGRTTGPIIGVDIPPGFENYIFKI